jgi:hypothetical protein
MTGLPSALTHMTSADLPLGGGWGWLVAAVLAGAVVPFTFVITMPTNHKLLAWNRDLPRTATRELLIR